MLNQELAKLPEGIAFSFSPPAIPGVGTSGGFTFVLEDRAGKDVQFLADNVNKFLAEAAQASRDRARLNTTFLPQRAAAVSSTSTATRCSSRASTSATSTRPCRPSWAASSSTTSTASAASGRSTSRPKASTARTLENVGQFYVRNNEGDMVPLSALTPLRAALRTRVHHALQPLPLRADHRRRAPGYSSAQAMKALEEIFAQDHAARDGLRLHGHVVPGEEGAAKASPPGDLRLLAAVRLPDPRRAVRELVAALQRPAEHADRRLRRLRRAVAAPHG